MSASEMQACLARLYTSSASRRLLHLDPEAVLDSYFLTAEEREAVAGIDRQQLDWFASSLKAKRRSRLERSFPALFAIGDPALGTFYERYHEVYPLRPGETSSVDTMQFGAFIEESLADSGQLPEYTRDLVRFERTLQEVRQRARPTRTDSSAGKQPAEDHCPERPSKRGDVTVAHFAYNVSEIDEALREGRDPDVRNESEFIVYSLREGDQDPHILRVSAATALVLELCNGERSVEEIVVAVEEHYSQPGLRESVVGVIRQLSASTILEEHDDRA